MNLNFFLSPWTVFFVALIIIIVMLIFLTLLERKLKKRISIKREEQSIFQKKLNALKSADTEPNKFLVEIDELARDFLSQHYKVDRTAKYSELAKLFKKQGNIGAAQFCERIQESFYSGEQPTKEKLEFLSRNLEFLIVEHNKIKETEGSLEKEKRAPSEELDKRIVKYLSEGLQRGFELELLRSKLLGAGFKKPEIQTAEEHLNLHLEKKDEVNEWRGLQKTQEKKLPVKVKKVRTKAKQDVLESESEITHSETKTMSPDNERFINSLDNLERIKGKISEKAEITGAKKISEKTSLV